MHSISYYFGRGLFSKSAHVPTFLFSAFLVLGSVALESHSAFADLLEVQVKGKKTYFYGPLGREAIERATAPAKIPALFEEFQMKMQGWDFKKNPVSFENDVTRFHFSIFRTESVAPPAPASGGGFWGTVGGYLHSAVRKVVDQVNKELIGQVVREEVECKGPYDKRGYEFKIDLAESSYSIQAITSQVAVKFCVQEASKGSDQEGVILAHSVSLAPGELFPGEDSPKFQEFMAQVTETLRRSLEDKIQREQIALIQEKLLAEDEAQNRK